MSDTSYGGWQLSNERFDSSYRVSDTLDGGWGRQVRDRRHRDFFDRIRRWAAADREACSTQLRSSIWNNPFYNFEWDVYKAQENGEHVWRNSDT